MVADKDPAAPKLMDRVRGFLGAQVGGACTEWWRIWQDHVGKVLQVCQGMLELHIYFYRFNIVKCIVLSASNVRSNNCAPYDDSFFSSSCYKPPTLSVSFPSHPQTSSTVTWEEFVSSHLAEDRVDRLVVGHDGWARIVTKHPASPEGEGLAQPLPRYGTNI